MKGFSLDWEELRLILRERPEPQAIKIRESSDWFTFKFIKDIEGDLLEIEDDYYDRCGEFIIQDIASKKKYICSYNESGYNKDDLEMFTNAPFYFTEYKKIEKIIKKVSKTPKKSNKITKKKSMEFKEQITDLKIVIDTNPRVYVTWVNTEEGRDRVDMYERIESDKTVYYNNFYNRSSFIFPSNNFWYDLEDLYRKAKEENDTILKK